MSNLFSGISGRFRASGRTGGGSSGDQAAQGGPSSTPPPPLPPASNLAPRMPPIQTTPSLSQTMAMNEPVGATAPNDILAPYNLPSPKPLWLNNTYAKHIVKGNFMTLSARPKTVEPGEWIAHQVVEHYRMLWVFVRVIHEQEDDGTSICNAQSCPKMSAGAHSFTWLNNRKEAVEVPAHEYISLMQRWISGKTDNTAIFPTDPVGVSYAYNTSGPEVSGIGYASGGLNTPGASTPIPAGPSTINAPLSQLAGAGDWVGKSSGFPADFFEVCQTIFRQMFRVYSHLYWAHFIEPFYHLNLDKHLNSCFSHFVLTSMELEMLKPSELLPMQPLVDLWAANGTFPTESKAYSCANLRAGEYLLQIAGASI